MAVCFQIFYKVYKILNGTGLIFKAEKLTFIKLVKIYSVYFFLFFLVISCTASSSEPKRPTGETLIVLGYPADQNGAPTAIMKWRLEKAFDIWEKTKATTVIVTGGAVQNDFAEAEVMKNYLIRKGIPDSVIIAENRSGSTIENAINSKKILKKLGLKNPIIVTSPEHRDRAKNTFEFFMRDFRMAQ